MFRDTDIAELAPFLLLSNAVKDALGVVVTNISLSPSFGWYFALTPFESILLGLVILKVIFLRLFTVLPIDLNKVFEGNSTGHFASLFRGKREVETQRLADTMFTVVRRLDMQDCLLRSLCELQVHSNHGQRHRLTSDTKLVLSHLSKSGWKRNQTDVYDQSHPKEIVEDRPALSAFEDAVLIGWGARTLNGTDCMERYFSCPLSTDDIMEHVEAIQDIHVA